MILIKLLEDLENIHKSCRVSGNLSMDDVVVSVKEGTTCIRFDPACFSLEANKSRTHSEETCTSCPSLFSSVSFDKDKPLGYKDDLESLAYMCIFMLMGNLPWKKSKLSLSSKALYPWKTLCYGLPVEICLFMKYVNSLEKDTLPDYETCILMLQNKLLVSNQDLGTFVYDWDQENSEDVALLENSIQLSNSSDSSFDPMAAKFIEFQTREYRKSHKFRSQTRENGTVTI